MFTLVLLLFLGVTAPNLVTAKECGCRRPLYSASAPFIGGQAVGEEIFEAFTDNYKTYEDPLVKGLMLDLKNVTDGKYILKENCYRLEVTKGVFEVENQNYTVSLTMVTSATDIGIVVDVCNCKQWNGRKELDFCRQYLRQRIFDVVIKGTCKFANNDPSFCCKE